MLPFQSRSKIEPSPSTTTRNLPLACPPTESSPTTTSHYTATPTSRIVVPTHLREKLSRKIHADLHHLSTPKVLASLSRHSFWPTMAPDTRRWLADCPECDNAKAKRRLAHGLFHGKTTPGPRTRAKASPQPANPKPWLYSTVSPKLLWSFPYPTALPLPSPPLC
jgi:hypothetical protein